MSDADDSRVAARAEQAEEVDEAGTAEPDAQAAQILAESDARSEDRDAAPTSYVEHRSSEDTVDPSA